MDMSDEYYGALYLLAPGEPYDRENISERVVEAYDHGRSHLDVAQELWLLAGDGAKANAIADIIAAAFERDLPVLRPEEVDALVALIDPLPDALARTVADDDLFIRPERMAEVRQYPRFIDVREERGELRKYGLIEAVSRAFAARNILVEARERGLDVSLD
jgi:hypothetical protein